MRRGPPSPVREWALIAVAFVVLAAVATIWLVVDRRPPEWDHANHLERAIRCARDLAGGDVGAVLERSSFYPPLVPCMAGLLFRLVPLDVAAAQGVMMVFLALGMAAVYAIGRERASGPAGVVAALLFGSAPFVVFNTVRFQLDLPLAALVALAVWLVLRTDGFRRRGWSLALGVVLGLGLLTKPPFPIYILPAVIWALAGERAGRRLANVALTALVALASSLAWYGPRLMGLPAQVASRSFKQAAESGHPDPLSWAALSIYPATLPMFFGAAATVLLAIGLVVAARRRRWLELASVLLPFAVFLMLQNKNARYTLPILPMASLVAAMALEALRPRVRTLAIGATVIACAVQVSATAFAMPGALAVPDTRLAAAIPAPPSGADWRHREILDTIGRHAGGAPGAATVSIVPNHAFFSAANFRYYAVRDGRPLRVVRTWDDPPLGVRYMVLKTGDVGPPWTEAKSRRAMARLQGDPALARVFPVIAEFPLPDGSTASVRAREVAPGVDATPATMAETLVSAVRAGLADFAEDVAGLDVRLEYDAGILQGRVRRLQIAADRASIGELRRAQAARLTVGDFRLVVDGLLVNPFSLHHARRFEPLDAGRVRLVKATIGAEDLQAFLREMKGFAHTSVRLEPDALRFAVRLPGPDVTGRVRVLSAPGRPFTLDADRVRVGGVPVPSVLAGWVFRNLDPAPRLASRLTVPVEIAGVRVATDAIRIAEP